MDIYGETLPAWSFGFAGAIQTALALILVRSGHLKQSRSRGMVALIAALGCGGAWGWLALAGVLSSASALPLLASWADVLRYGCWIAFLLILTEPQNPPLRQQRFPPLAILGALLVIAGLAAHTFAGLGLRFYAGESRVASLTSTALAILGLVLVEQLFRNASQDSRWNVKPICVALVGCFAFDLYVYSQAVLFDKVDVDAFSIRGAVHGLIAPLLMVSSIRRRDWISKLRFSRSAAFHSATLLICGAYLLFISSVGYYVRYFGGEWGRALQIGAVFLSLILLTIFGLSGTVRAKLRLFVSKNFFRYRYDYREEWLKFTRTLCEQNTPQEMGQQVIRGLADLVESPGGTLWMKVPGTTTLRQTTRLNMMARQEPEYLNSSLCQTLAREGMIINLEEYRSSPRSYEQLELPPWLQATPEAWLIVPLMVGEEMIGFVVLQSARTNVDANWEVYDLLKTASRQAASFLAQMVATEALLEVRKFDAFNRMSAFVVHDLKNIVTQLSLMMRNAKRLHANPEFQQDMLMTVENSLERMRQLMAQLREGNTPAGAAFGVDLSGLVSRIEAAAVQRGRQLQVDVKDTIVTRGSEERLERVIGHIVQNAFDATSPCDRVWLNVERLGGQARIEVGDEGHGMSMEFVRDRLFRPFQSTKATGMGIGAYESYQYVQELGGKINVESEPQKGTRVTLLLPVVEAQKESDLDLLKVSE